MSNNDLEKALEPAPQKKNPFKFIILGLVAVLIIAAGYWLTQQFLLKGEVEIPLPKEVAEAVSDNLRLDDGKLGPVRITPNTPQENTRPANRPAPGTAPEPNRPSAAGIIVEPGKSATELLAAEAPAAPGEPRRKIYSGSDAVVTVNFASDLATYLADNYWPRGTHIAAKNGSVSSASLGSAGQRYGIELTGFASTRDESRRDYLRDRALVLNYAYMPAMLEALTRLYADRFADQLAQAGLKQVRSYGAQDRPLNEAEVGAMLRFYADYARSLSAALQAYNGHEEAGQTVQRYTAARDAAFLANGRMHEARYLAEEARETKNSRLLREAQQDIKNAEQEYRKAMLEQERAKEAVLAFMHKGISRRLDDHELLYIAAWAARRGQGAGPANQAAAAAADFIGQVLDEKAVELE